MKLVNIFILLLLPWLGLSQNDPEDIYPYPSPPAAATNITAAEYFFDADPGYGNGIPITSLTPGLDVNINNLSLDINGLSNGVHTVFIRTQNTDGEWSQTSSRSFLIEADYSPSPAPVVNITDAEYFFDADPGLGNGISVPVTDGINVSLNNLSLDLSGLSNGVHTVFLRTKDANGTWSQTSNKTILIEPGYSPPPAAASNIVAAEYFTSGAGLGGDPGFGQATAISVPGGQTDITLTNEPISISGLVNGINYIYLRTQNADGEWSQTSIEEFEIINDPIYPSAPPATTDVVAAEYFFDTDPGFGSGTSIPITDGQDISDISLSADVSGLGEGVHFLFLRTQNADGEWGQTSSKEFEVVLDFAYPSPPPAPTNIVAAEYFIDNDPGFGAGTPVTTFAAGQDIMISGESIDINSLSPGTHYLFLRTQNADGKWSQTSIREFTIQDATDCTATSTWDGTNWNNGAPDATTQAIIDGDLALDADAEWCAIEILSGTFTINQGVKLTLNETNDAVVVASTGNADIAGIISSAGNIDNSGTVTFKSNAIASGQLDVFPAAASITGDFSVEHYMSANRAFRYVSSSVGGSQTIRQAWQENASTSNFNPNPGFGTHITGAQGTVGNVAANGFDETLSGNPSLYTFNNVEQFYEPVTTTNVTLQAGTAYALFKRGDRSVNLLDNLADGETTLRATGALLTGSKSSGTDFPALSTAVQGFSLVPNPYQAKVDFNALSFSGGVNPDFLYVFDPSVPNFGDFVVLENPTDASDMFIHPGQSFFVINDTDAANISTPAITFNEDDKATGSTPTITVFNELALANLELYNANNQGLDMVKFRFEENAFNGVDNFDALKLVNPGENIGRMINNKLYEIERRAMPQDNEVIPLTINQYQGTQYELRLVTENWDDGIDVFVQDNYLNTTTPINVNQPYSFTVDASIPASSAEDRFSLVFDNTTLGVTDNSFGANFSVYPNPVTNGLFSIRTPGLSGEVSLEISNILGQKVMAQSLQVDGNQVNVDAQGLASGIYLVKLSQNNESFTTKVILE